MSTNKLSFIKKKKKKNLRFVSVYCQALLSTTAYLFSFLLSAYAFSHLTFYCSPSFFLSSFLSPVFFSLALDSLSVSLSLSSRMHNNLIWIMTTTTFIFVEKRKRKRSKRNCHNRCTDGTKSIRRKNFVVLKRLKKIS